MFSYVIIISSYLGDSGIDRRLVTGRLPTLPACSACPACVGCLVAPLGAWDLGR